MITVEDYDPGWPIRFDALRAAYATALEAAEVPSIGVEHVGSTSVPGLAAKPIMDVDIVVPAADMAAASDVLVYLGFRPLGDLGIPERWAFAAPAAFAGTNTYVVEAGSLALRNHLAVREALRSDAALRDEYSALKRRVAGDAANVDAYRHGKGAIVQKILTTAGLTEQERTRIEAINSPAETSRPQ